MTIQINDFDDLKQLIKLIKKSQVNEFEMTDSHGVQIRVVQGQSAPAMVAPTVQTVLPEPVGIQQPAPQPVAAPQVQATPDSTDGQAVESPMVGTVYLSPSPDEPPFVKEGDRVQAGDTLCLVEAMKMFNKIQAEQSGVVKRCCVTNGQAVEFGQSLFIIEA